MKVQDKVPVRAIPAGAKVTVRTRDGYTVTGRFIGLTQTVDGPKARVLAWDGLERHVPAAGLTAVLG